MTIDTASPTSAIDDPDDSGDDGAAALWHALFADTEYHGIVPADPVSPTPGSPTGSAPGQSGDLAESGYAGALTGSAGDAGFVGSASYDDPQFTGLEPGSGASTAQAAAGDTGLAGPTVAGSVTLTQLLQAIGDTGVSATGKGIKVGVISDSFDSLGGYAANDDDGLLPAGVQVATYNGVSLDENAGVGSDEGAAMLEIIHAIAPQASLAFASGNLADGGQSDAQFADAIQALVNAGCNVIVDDLTDVDEPFFQTGPIGQAIANAETAGVTYVTNAGNSWGGSTDNVGYLSSWNEIANTTYDGVTLTDALNFGGGSPVQTVTITPGTRGLGSGIPLVVQWAQPWGVSASDVSNLQLVLFQNGKEIGAYNNQTPGNGGITPPTGFTSNEFAFIEFDFNVPTTTQTYQIAIENLTPSDNPPEVEDMLELNGFNEVDPPTNTAIDTPSSVSPANTGGVFGHHASPDAITVGAIEGMDTPAFNDGGAIANEPYSASDPAPPLWYNLTGGEVTGAPESLSSPIALSGVDGIQTDVTSGTNEKASSFSLTNPFLGTSAAGPTVAGVVALMLQENPKLTEPQIKQILEQTAIPTSTPEQAGAGLVDAAAAVNEAAESTPPFALSDGPLSLTQGTTAAIPSTLLRFGDTASTPAQETYSIITAPADGTLLLNGSSTTSFTQADINAGDLSYQESALGATADSFTFTVTGVADNTTATQTFNIAITSTAKPFAVTNSPLSLAQGTTATIGPSLLRFGDAASSAAGLTYTITSAPSEGTLLLNGNATTSFTGAEVNAGDLSYKETGYAASDSFTFTVSDSYGNTTGTQTFNIGITSTAKPFALDDGPLSLAQGTTATIGSSLLRYGDAASTAAGLTYTVTSGPGDGTLLLNGTPVTSFTGAQVNAGDLSYQETGYAASDSFAFTVTDPYGNSTATQTFNIGITSTAKPFALDDGPLSLAQGTTATIGSSLLRYGDAASTAAGLTYTVTGGPSDGTLLLNGTPVTSFTGAEVNAGDLSYQETGYAASDSFAFTVTDPYGNTTATQTFAIGITSTAKPFALDDGPLLLAQGATAAIGPSLLRFGDAASTAAGLTYTVTSGPSDGTLLLNGSATTSFTGAQVNAGDLSYKETASGAASDSFSFKVSDPYGNTTSTETFSIQITAPPFALDDSPLTLTQGTTATIGPSLLRFGASDTTAAGLTYTVTSGPSDGTLLLNGAPTTSFTGAEANADDISYEETAPGATSDAFSFTVADPYGNSTPAETFQFHIVSTVPPFELDDSPLSLAQGATAIIGPSLLRFGDVASTAAQVLYTVTSGPSDGTLLLNGTATTSFTGAEVNANQLSYHETANSVTSDSFAFTVSDPYGNATATQHFQISI